MSTNVKTSAHGPAKRFSPPSVSPSGVKIPVAPITANKIDSYQKSKSSGQNPSKTV